MKYRPILSGGDTFVALNLTCTEGEHFAAVRHAVNTQSAKRPGPPLVVEFYRVALG